MRPPISADEKKTRILVVEGSDRVRTMLIGVVCADQRLELMGAVASAESALRQLEMLAPDVILMDLNLPGMSGIEATRRIMSETPIPIVSFSPKNTGMEALEAGAVSIIEKPEPENPQAFAELAGKLADHLISFSGLKLVRRPFANPTPGSQRGITQFRDAQISRMSEKKAVGIVASTGGPNALASIFSKLPQDFPLPVLLVQHIGETFVGGFATWLSTICPLQVCLGKTGDNPLPGTIYVAPGHAHMTVRHGRIQLEHTEPVDGHRPSGSALLSSMADYWGAGAIGVVLTGMGTDGAAGLARMHEMGAFTIAQNEKTSVVYGMPAAAAALSATSIILPLGAIPETLVKIATASRADSGKSIKSEDLDWRPQQC